MARGRTSMAQWIHEAINDIDKIDASGVVQSCTALTLIHMLGTDQDEVHTVKLGVVQGSGPRSPTELEVLFLDKAEFRAKHLSGLQTFVLQAFYADSAKPGARMIFTVMPPVFGENGLMTESPTPTGQLQQGMRQSDMAFMQMFRQQTATNEILVGFAERQSRHIERLETENRDTFMLLKTMIMDQIHDRHERDKELLAMERNTKLIEQLVKYGPVIANTLAGRDLFPQSSADTVLVETVAEALTPERAAKLMEAFGDSPLIGAVLLSRVEQYHKQRAAAEAAIQQRPPANTDGELDAVGGIR